MVRGPGSPLLQLPIQVTRTLGTHVHCSLSRILEMADARRTPPNRRHFENGHPNCTGFARYGVRPVLILNRLYQEFARPLSPCPFLCEPRRIE